MKKLFGAWWLIAGLFAGGVWGSRAENQVGFAWDASPSPNVGYRLKVADSNDVVRFTIDVGPELTCSVSNLPPELFHVWVVAYYQAQPEVESDRSNLIVFQVPAAPTAVRLEAVLQVNQGTGWTNAMTMGVYDVGSKVGSGIYRVAMTAAAPPPSP